MKVRALDPDNPTSLRRALVRHGVDPVRADAIITGRSSLAVFVEHPDPPDAEALLRDGRELGLDCLSGPDWVLVAGPVSRLAGLTRPGHSSLSPSLAESLGAVLRGRAEPPDHWHTARGAISLERPLVAGILNVTPDSFSDGGRFLEPGPALRQAETLAAEGADLIDIGAESTRPGPREPVSAEEEWRRLDPVLTGIARELPEIVVSIDTYRSDTARRAVDRGAAIINDVSGFRFDPRLPAVCADTGVGVVLMHSRGAPAEIASYEHAGYEDVVFDVAEELGRAVDRARTAGVRREALVLDPGLGFAKRPAHNREILDRLGDFAALGFPVMVGPSRKRFLRAMLAAGADPDPATGVLCAAAWLAGASVFRVHRADTTRGALDVVAAIRGS